jgi:hypothetical protein
MVLLRRFCLCAKLEASRSGCVMTLNVTRAGATVLANCSLALSRLSCPSPSPVYCFSIFFPSCRHTVRAEQSCKEDRPELAEQLILLCGRDR